MKPSRNRIDVLDRGYVELVNHLGDDTAISNAARVTDTDEPWRGEDDQKLLKYMLRNKHTSPFEHVVFTFNIKAPIFVVRQWHRHRTQSYNEYSARYKELPEEFYVPKPEHIGKQDGKNHQSRIMESTEHQLETAGLIREACAASFREYKRLLAGDCPREIARGVLPANTYTYFFSTVNLHNLMHFLRLRLDEHAQYEIRMYAEALLELAREVVPFTIGVFDEERMK